MRLSWGQRRGSKRGWPSVATLQTSPALRRVITSATPLAAVGQHLVARVALGLGDPRDRGVSAGAAPPPQHPAEGEGDPPDSYAAPGPVTGIRGHRGRSWLICLIKRRYTHVGMSAYGRASVPAAVSGRRGGGDRRAVRLSRGSGPALHSGVPPSYTTVATTRKLLCLLTEEPC